MISSYYGSILLLGRTNVGKSTLLNFLVKKKISITSHKKNTTNNNIIGVYNNDIYQIEFIDTPGNIFSKNKIFNLLKNNKYDFILFILDKNKWNYIEENFTKIFSKINIPIILIINKVDQIKNKNILLPYINFLKKKINIFYLFIISAKYKLYTNNIYDIICSNLPKKKHLYPKNYITDQTDQVIIKEIIRENIMKFLHKEIPYLIKIKVIFSKILLNEINIIFLVKKINHKKIIIGKNSNNIKLIKNRSEQNIEKFFKKKLKLNIWIKIQ
ncbi:GTPase Era [Enterobacteriaceae endosymbiont of Donacia crassipes]|uniref:GTPase Era n=1 Tax=Enterobacteriaceae endosymbiont of Donacia crassipes TaxID=2675776 RepID=UPI0014499569|nr:GTPase Era [Enterobacteriaceae endosymbiont of Donacia crassipes]QJC34469.1 GTPase Era [Enterobacteriaceae endosymbiont of Donacia crassipes]